MRAEQSRAEQSRAEQSRAEQSRAEQSRADNIDILKAICAFLIVCIHVPFPGKVGAYFTTLTRVAVPVFFMITGYFYSDTVARHKEERQIRKIFFLVVEANAIFFIWNIALGILRRDSMVTYVQEIFTGKSILKFLALNESPLAGQLMVDLIDTIVYAGRLKDKSALMSSSSGGAFTALSDFFLKNGNAVVAAVYNYENHTAEFQMIRDEKQREGAKGSKYMQSKPGDIYWEAYSWLMENQEKELLFVGMGCQSDGFRKFSEIKGIRDQVYIVDIICHGSPSPKLWREYAELIQKKDGKITYLTFKDKRNGWKSPTAYVKVNGAEKPIKDYVKVFYNRCALRPSCYECPYATTERKTDMTIGDFWHIEETIPDFYGVSRKPHQSLMITKVFHWCW